MSLGCKRRREEGAAGSSGIDDYFWVNGDASQRGFKEFFRNEELSDCVLETSIGKSFKCHKVVLAAASPVFRAMFRSTMTEGTSSKVQMHDASAEAVQLLLRLVYGKSAMVPVKLSLELYMLADQYQLSRAADMIAEATGKALTPEALCFVLPEAHSTLINTSTLVRELLRRAAELIRVLPTCQQYQGWDLPLVQQVMRSDHSGRVYLILKAAAKWVQAAYDSRRQYWLGDLMPLISFDRLTTAELRHIKQHDPELLQLEGVGNALFKASCSKLQRDYYEISPNSPRYDDWRQMPPRRRSRSRSWSRSPRRRPSRSLSRSISRSRSRSLSGDLRRRRRSISRERSISQDYSGFESDTSGGQDDVPGGNLDDVQGNAMEVQADAMPDQGDAMEAPDNADGAQVNAIGTQDNAQDAQEHAVDAQDHVVDAQDNAMEVQDDANGAQDNAAGAQANGNDGQNIVEVTMP